MGKSAKQHNTEPQGLHILAKPAGPSCNLNCEYCFYLEKHALFDNGKTHRMSDEVLQAYISKYIASQPAPVVEFVWQGGEPTLMGLDFFKKVIAYQKPFAANRTIVNSLQTNGTLLTDKWCEFLKDHNFLVGISIDGPEDIHNQYRRYANGRKSFDTVKRGLRLLQKHGVDYNVMACVARETAKRPLDVYRFFKDENVNFIQFFPIVERMPDACAQQNGMRLAMPSSLDKEEGNTQVTPWSVEPEAYGDFLIAVFDEWVRKDVGMITVMNFEWALNAWIGNSSPVCLFAKQCGRSIVMEHNGDMYACDHCVYPQYKLGNILIDDPMEAVERSLSTGFGVNKESQLPRWCRECEVLKACYGGCPKHRFTKTHYGEPGLHYLCQGYKKYFKYIRKYLKVMTQLIEHGLPASHVMDAIDRPLVFKLEQNEEIRRGVL